MNHEQSFAVSRFENRNGVTSWRVDGRLHGVRIRRNFKTQEEAAAEKAALEMKAMQSAAGMQSVTTFLAADQFREAEAVFRRLAGRPRPLSFYVEFALANYREPVTQKLRPKRSRNTSPPSSTNTSRTCFPSRTSRA